MTRKLSLRLLTVLLSLACGLGLSFVVLKVFHVPSGALASAKSLPGPGEIQIHSIPLPDGMPSGFSLNHHYASLPNSPLVYVTNNDSPGYPFWIISGTQIITRVLLGSAAMPIASPANGLVYLISRSGKVQVFSDTQVIASISLPGFSPAELEIQMESTAYIDTVTGILYISMSKAHQVVKILGTEVLATIGVPCKSYDDTRIFFGYPGKEPVYFTGSSVWGSDTLVSVSGNNATCKTLNGWLSNQVGTILPEEGLYLATNYYDGMSGLSVSKITVFSGTQVITQVEFENGFYKLQYDRQSDLIYAKQCIIDVFDNDCYLSVLRGTNVITTLQSTLEFFYSPASGYIYSFGWGNIGNSISVYQGIQLLGSQEVSNPKWSNSAIDPKNGGLYLVNDTHLFLMDGTELKETNIERYYDIDHVQASTGDVYLYRDFNEGPYLVYRDLKQVSTIPAEMVLSNLVYNPANQRVYLSSVMNSNNLQVLQGTEIIGGIQFNDLYISPYGGEFKVDSLNNLVYVNNNMGIFAIQDKDVVFNYYDGGTSNYLNIPGTSPQRGYTYIFSWYEHRGGEFSHLMIMRGTELVEDINYLGEYYEGVVNPVGGFAYLRGLTPPMDIYSGTQLVAQVYTPMSERSFMLADPLSRLTYQVSLNGMYVLRDTSVVKYTPFTVPITNTVISAASRGYTYFLAEDTQSLAVYWLGDYYGDIPISGNPSNIDVDQSSGIVYLAYGNIPEITVIDQGKIVRQIEVPLSTSVIPPVNNPYLRDLATASDTGDVYISNYFDRSLSLIELGPHYFFAAGESIWNVVPGTSTRTFQLVERNGFTGTVALSISGLPEGVQYEITPNPAPPSGTVTITLTVPEGVTFPSTPIVLTGESAGITQTYRLILTLMQYQVWMPALWR